MMRRKERLSRHIAKKLDLFAYIFAQAVFFQFVLSERASETDKSIIIVCGYRLRGNEKRCVPMEAGAPHPCPNRPPSHFYHFVWDICRL